MAHYVVLVQFTPEGIANVEESAKRAAAFKDLAASMGVTVETILWTLGAWDIVCLLDAPDDETATALALSISKRGNIKTQTLRAFDAGEFESIVAKMR